MVLEGGIRTFAQQLRLQHSQGDTVLFRQTLPRPILPEHGHFVAGVRPGETPDGDLQDAQPYGYEHIVRIVLADLAVHPFQHGRRIQACLGGALEHGAGGHHEQRRGDALAAHVRHHQRQVILVHHEEVVEIAADLLGGGHGGKDVELSSARERRERARQHVGLDAGRHVQLADEAFPFGLCPVLFLHDAHLAAVIPADQQDQTCQHCRAKQDIDPHQLIKGPLLYNGYAQHFASAAQRILQLHVKAIGAAAQVRVGHRPQLAAADGGLLLVEAIQPERYHWVRQRIVEHIGIDRQLLHLGRKRKPSRFIGIKALSVRIDKGDRLFELGDVLQRRFDTELDDAGVARHVEHALRRQLAVGVEVGDAGQAVGNPIMDGLHFSVVDQLLRGQDIDPVAAEDPHITLAVFIQVGVIGIREIVHRGHLIVRGHIGNGVSCDQPEEIPRGVIFDVHDHPGSQAVLCADVPHAVFVDDIHSAAVGTQHGISVRRGTHA